MNKKQTRKKLIFGLIITGFILTAIIFAYANNNQKTNKNDASLIINTGFLQNKNCDKCLYKSLDSFLVQVKIGPNPTEHNLYTHVNQSGLIWQGWEMYNLEGKLLERRVINLSGLRLQYTINLSNYSKGIYFLKYYFLIDQQISIIKTIQIYKS